MSDAKRVALPCPELPELSVGDRVVFSGTILAGRDAVLPKVCAMLAEGRGAELGVDLAGAAVLHTAVSPAGIGPTSSNKIEIEESFGPLLRAGVRVFLGKGAISGETVQLLAEYGGVFAVVPPVTALLGRGMRASECAAFPELGMEALYKLELDECPAIIAAANGMSVFGRHDA